MVAGEVSTIVKYFALGLESTACKTIMQNSELSKTVKKLVIKEMDNELEELCKKKNSILRQTKPEELLAFKIEKFAQEIEQQTPLINEFLQSSCCSNSKKRASENALPSQCIKATIAATILRERCPEMSAMAYRTGLILRHAGTGGMVCFIFCSVTRKLTNVHSREEVYAMLIYL